MHGRKNKQSSFYWGKNLHAFANKQQKSFPLFILAGNIRHNGALLSRDFFLYAIKILFKASYCGVIEIHNHASHGFSVLAISQ